MMPLTRTCRETAALLVAQEDRRLKLTDRIALRMHLVICDVCPQFERQLLILRNSMKQWRNYTTAGDRMDP